MEDKKQKYAYWLKPSLVMEMESMLDDANATSKSDFVTQAIKFYIGYLRQKKCVDFISTILAQSIKSEIGSVEQNISKMLFKLSVEQSIVNNLIASQNEIDEFTMARLRNSCCEEVARLGGVITKVNAGKLIRYMGTREGVEKLPDGIDNKPPTQKQRDLIC